MTDSTKASERFDAVSETENLLHEALNLCVRAKKLDEAVLEQHCVEIGAYRNDHTVCMTPHIWLLDQYDKDLADWENRARLHLLSKGRNL